MGGAYIGELDHFNKLDTSYSSDTRFSCSSPCLKSFEVEGWVEYRSACAFQIGAMPGREHDAPPAPPQGGSGNGKGTKGREVKGGSDWTL